MTDQELADRIVALGVGEKSHHSKRYIWWETSAEDLTIHKFVRDWRVAGALLKKHRAKFDKPFPAIEYDYDSMPLAICEACVEAIEGSEGA